jgi:hypothetical protein
MYNTVYICDIITYKKRLYMKKDKKLLDIVRDKIRLKQYSGRKRGQVNNTFT